MLDLETYSLLLKQDWNDIGRQLTAFVVYLAKNWGWRLGEGGELVAGTTAEDIAWEAIQKAVDGRRKWDPKKGEILPWLRDQAKSELDHLLRAHKREAPVLKRDDSEDLVDKDESYARRSDSGTAVSPDPEEMVLQKEEIQLREEALFRATDGDRELERLLEAVSECGSCKPQELAAELGIPPQDIYNQLRRLRRRALELLERETREKEKAN